MDRDWRPVRATAAAGGTGPGGTADGRALADVRVGQQVHPGDQDEVGPPEHVRVLQRLVLALGHRGEHDPGGLPEVEQCRADQVPDVLDQQHRSGGRIERGQALATIAASRWHPTPVLICTTRQPTVLTRRASSAVS
ncbi:MAG: hypothetical protein ACYCVZ_13605 [Streptosporangiaceae bacterium]